MFVLYILEFAPTLFVVHHLYFSRIFACSVEKSKRVCFLEIGKISVLYHYFFRIRVNFGRKWSTKAFCQKVKFGMNFDKK